MNTITQETVVVFKHTLDIDALPEIQSMPPEFLKQMLDKMVIELFELRKKEVELNANNSGAATCYVEVK